MTATALNLDARGYAPPVGAAGTAYWSNAMQGLRELEAALPVSAAARGVAASASGAANTANLKQTIADAVAMGKKLVQLPAGVLDFAQDGSNAWAISLPSDIVLTGWGRGTTTGTTLRIAAAQVNFTRLIDSTATSGGGITNCSLDGNLANNPSNADTGQQHGVFLNGVTDFIIDNVEIHHTLGDGIYLFNHCKHVTITRTLVHDGNRVGIHTQSYEDCSISDCHFYSWRSTGQGFIKSETDNEGETGVGLTVDNCTFDGAGGNPNGFGILPSGLSATTKMADVTLTNNVIRNCGVGIQIGIFLDGLTVTGNVLDGCNEGIRSTSYNTTYGYTAHVGTTITGNVVRNLTGSSASEYGIYVTNSEFVTITANAVNGSALLNGVRVDHCDRVEITGNAVTAGGGASAIGYNIYRCLNLRLSGSATVPGGTGAQVADDGPAGTYQSNGLYLGELSLTGPVATGVNVNALANGALTLGTVSAPGATNIVAGYSIAKATTDFRIRAPIIATASLPAASTARDGSLVIEDNGTGDRNLIVYAGGQRFRIDGGAAF